MNENLILNNENRIKYLSWFYYTYDAIQIELWGNTGAIACSTPKNITISCQRYESGQAVLDLYNVDKVKFYR